MHNHDHSDGGHHHHHHHAPSNFNLAFALATLLNLAFTAIETGYAIYAKSMSLLADAGHNFSDVLGLLMSWAASWLLTRHANERYSYGYKKTSIIAALLNAVLLVAASAIIIYESINKLLHPTVVNETIIIIVAVIGIFINGGTALLFMRGRNDDLNIKSAYWHLASDAVISIGVVIAGIVIAMTGWLWLDPAVGIVIVLTILIGTWGLLRDSVNLILDAVPTNIDLPAIRNYFTQLEGVQAVHDLHIWGLSTRDVALTAHLVMPEKSLTDEDYATINQTLKTRFNIQHATIQVEKSAEANLCDKAAGCNLFNH